ncbi:MAG: YlbF family regulator [Halothermotrichaceae bacterium]
MSVYDNAHRLKANLLKSDEYTEYQEIRKKILDDENTKEMLLDYQQMQIKLQTKQMSGQELTDEDKEKLENLRKIIELNNNIKKYLQAEYRMSIMLNDIQKIIFEDLEMGISKDEDNGENTKD